MKKKILIDALFINIGGGLTLLNNLLISLESSSSKIQLLLDKRIKNSAIKISNLYEKKYIEGSFFKRHLFYLKHKDSFKKVLCFANIPPSVEINSAVYTYFHQYSYINLPVGTPYIDHLKWFVKTQILKFLTKNTDKWFVQSEHVKHELINKFKLDDKTVECYPMFSWDYDIERARKKIKNKFVYVSYSYSYKNHLRLIEAFANAYKECKKGELHLTVDKNHNTIMDKITFFQEKGVPIYNYGLITKEKVDRLYSEAEYLIFPSLMESFGLPLIEGIGYGCKIIVSRLPYANAICIPSLSFDPYTVSDISKAIIHCLSNSLHESKLKISNKTEAMVKILIE